MANSTKAVPELVHAIFSANGRFIDAGNQLVADLGLTSALWQVLAALCYSPEALPAASIARKMGLTRQGVQRVLDLLAEQKMIEFQDNPHHRRAKLAGLTPRGRKAVASAESAVEPLNQKIIKKVGSKRLQAATETLTEISAVISEHFRSADEASSKTLRPKG